MLKANRLKEDVAELAEAAFNEAWKEEVVYVKERERIIHEQARKAKEKIRKLTDEVLSTRNEELKQVYEKELAETAKELRGLENLTPLSEDTLGISYQTALTKATQMLKSPYIVWESVGVHEKHRLFSFIFEEKLAFSKSGGYQTAKSSIATRLFEEIATENPLDVDLRGVEPRPRPCHGRVLPLNYRPVCRTIANAY